MVEEWKWRGVPVWEHGGIICTGETYKAVVKLTFAKGAALEDPSGLFNSSLEGNVRRAIDIHEGDKIDEKALKALIRAAVALNASARATARPVRSRRDSAVTHRHIRRRRSSRRVNAPSAAKRTPSLASSRARPRRGDVTLDNRLCSGYILTYLAHRRDAFARVLPNSGASAVPARGKIRPALGQLRASSDRHYDRSGRCVPWTGTGGRG